MDDVQRKIQLRNRYVTINKGRLNPNHSSRKQKEQIFYKQLVDKVEKTKEVKQLAPTNVEKTVSTFNMQT